MNYRDQDDELERMRARRRSSAHPRRQMPLKGHEAFEDTSYDDDYYEEEHEYKEEVDNFLIEPEPDIWEKQPGRQRSGRGSSVARRNPEHSGSASRAGRTKLNTRATRSSSGKSPHSSIQSGQRSSSRDSRRSSSRQRETMVKGKKKNRWKYILLFLFLLFIAYGAWLFLHRPTGNWTIAVFGVDSRDGSTKQALADVQMICNIDRSTGEIKLVSVYRDTYLKINSEGTYHKINEAYFRGGHEQAVNALEENLDLKIDDYAAFNWKAVAEAINILGGVDLEMTQAEFEGINGFITETVESTGIASVHLTHPGMNHLDGVQAVAYCRLRLMDTDFQRTERQRKVVMLALDKAKQADASTLTSLAGYLIQQISTSVGVGDVLPLVKDIDKFHIGETAGFPFSRQTMRVGRMDCVIPTTLESNVILLHQFLYGEEVSYNPSSAVKKISARISDETGLYEEGKVAPSSGSSGSSSSQNQQGGEPVPAPTQPPETAPVETLPVEESTEAITEEAEETEETIEETEEIEEEGGPGVSDLPSKEPEGRPDETKEQGPGAGGPGESARPVETTASAPESPTAGGGPGSGGSEAGSDSTGSEGPGEGGPGI